MKRKKKRVPKKSTKNNNIKNKNNNIVNSNKDLNDLINNYLKNNSARELDNRLIQNLVKKINDLNDTIEQLNELGINIIINLSVFERTLYTQEVRLSDFGKNFGKI